MDSVIPKQLHPSGATLMGLVVNCTAWVQQEEPLGSPVLGLPGTGGGSHTRAVTLPSSLGAPAEQDMELQECRERAPSPVLTPFAFPWINEAAEQETSMSL